MSDTRRDPESGATAVEYALMVALLFLAIVAAVTVLGISLAGWFGATAAVL